MKLLGLLQLLLFLLFLPLTSPHCLFNASITIPPSTATICLPLPHVETTIINLCTVTSTPLLNCLATIAPPLETLPTRETPPHELYPLTITAPQSHTITQYATNQRLYFTLSLSNYTTTTRNACIHLDLNENTVWCGHVSSEGHETLYLTQRDTKMLGEGLHVAKVVVDSSSDGGVTFGTVFEMVQPRIEITSVADDVVHVNVEGFDVAKNSRWRTCLIVNDIPRCAPAANFTPKNFTLPGFTGGHVTPMILDEVCGKVLWMGREVRVYGEPSEPEPHELACLLCDLRSVEYGLYSQNGEDGVILYLLTHVIKHDYRGTPVTYFEFGAESGVEVNTRLLRERFNATGVLMDGGYEDPRIGLHKEFITQENVRMLKEKYHVADDVDVLSVDLDRNDWWILKALMEGGIQPKLIIVEYNSHYDDGRTVAYVADAKWDGKSRYFGASLTAFETLMRKYGYELVHCEKHGVNAFFVRSEFLTGMARREGGVERVNPNFFGRGWDYPPKEANDERWVQVVDEHG